MGDDRHSIQYHEKPEIILLKEIRDLINEGIEISKDILQGVNELCKYLESSESPEGP